jgi:hypothetical protein
MGSWRRLCLRSRKNFAMKLIFSPFLLTAFNISSMQIGKTGDNTCGIISSNYFLFFNYIPIWVTFFIGMFWYCRMVNAMKTKMKLKNVMAFPLLLFIIWIPNSVDRILYQIEGHNAYSQNFNLSNVNIFVQRLQGLFLSILFYRRFRTHRMKRTLSNSGGIEIPDVRNSLQDAYED